MKNSESQTPFHSPELDVWLERVDRLVDGEAFTEVERARIAEWVDSDAIRGRELVGLQELHRLLDEVRAPVRDDLIDLVMSRLAQNRRPSLASWAAAAAAALFLGVVAFFLLSSGGPDAGGWMVGPSGAIVDFMISATLAGAGLLGASWRGVGDVVGGWLFESSSNLVLGVVAVAAANLLMAMLLRRGYARRVTAQNAAGQSAAGQSAAGQSAATEGTAGTREDRERP